MGNIYEKSVTEILNKAHYHTTVEEPYVRRVQETAQIRQDYSRTSLRNDTGMFAIANDKVRKKQSQIADDQINPSKISQQFSEMYENEWTEANDYFRASGKYNEEEACELLLHLLCSIYNVCKEKAEDDLDNLFTAMKTFVGEEATKDVVKYLNEKRIMNNKAHLDHLKRRLQEKVRRLLPDDVQRRAGCTKAFVERGLELCWLMVIRDPPIYMDTVTDQKHDRFDSTTHVQYAKLGPYVDFIVWPTLYISQNGSVLSKGIAKCAQSRTKESLDDNYSRRKGSFEDQQPSLLKKRKDEVREEKSKTGAYDEKGAKKKVPVEESYNKQKVTEKKTQQADPLENRSLTFNGTVNPKMTVTSSSSDNKSTKEKVTTESQVKGQYHDSLSSKVAFSEDKNKVKHKIVRENYDSDRGSSNNELDERISLRTLSDVSEGDEVFISTKDTTKVGKKKDQHGERNEKATKLHNTETNKHRSSQEKLQHDEESIKKVQLEEKSAQAHAIEDTRIREQHGQKHNDKPDGVELRHNHGTETHHHNDELKHHRSVEVRQTKDDHQQALLERNTKSKSLGYYEKDNEFREAALKELLKPTNQSKRRNQDAEFSQRTSEVERSKPTPDKSVKLRDKQGSHYDSAQERNPKSKSVGDYEMKLLTQIHEDVAEYEDITHSKSPSKSKKHDQNGQRRHLPTDEVKRTTTPEVERRNKTDSAASVELRSKKDEQEDTARNRGAKSKSLCDYERDAKLYTLSEPTEIPNRDAAKSAEYHRVTDLSRSADFKETDQKSKMTSEQGRTRGTPERRKRSDSDVTEENRNKIDPFSIPTPETRRNRADSDLSIELRKQQADPFNKRTPEVELRNKADSNVSVELRNKHDDPFHHNALLARHIKTMSLGEYEKQASLHKKSRTTAHSYNAVPSPKASRRSVNIPQIRIPYEEDEIRPRSSSNADQVKLLTPVEKRHKSESLSSLEYRSLVELRNKKEVKGDTKPKRPKSLVEFNIESISLMSVSNCSLDDLDIPKKSKQGKRKPSASNEDRLRKSFSFSSETGSKDESKRSNSANMPTPQSQVQPKGSPRMKKKGK